MTVAAIIGDGAAGTTAAFYLRRTDPKIRIQMYCDEPTPAYYRAALTNYMLGELRAEQLFAVPPTFFEDFSLERITARVKSVDPEQRVLELGGGRQASYDKLLVASGARPVIPPIPGSEVEGFMAMRTMQDARTILDRVAGGKLKRAVVVGGGILGLELVSALRTRGADVAYVVRGNAFMSGILDKVASDLVFARCRHFGVGLRLSEEVAEIESKAGKLTGVKLKSSGDVVKAGLVVVAAGIRPNIEFLEGSGVETKRGVLVDSSMSTNVDSIFAAGDVAEVVDPATGRTRVMGLWEPARHQGRVAGLNMAGGSGNWSMGVNYDATRLYDLDLAVAGSAAEEPGDDVLSDFPDTEGVIAYRKLVLRGDRLAGALLVGHRSAGVRARGRLYRELIASGADVSGIRDSLLDPFFDLSGWVDSLEVPAAYAPGRPSRPAMRTIMGARPGRHEAAPARRSLAVLMGNLAGGEEAAVPQIGEPRSLSRPTLGPSALPAWVADVNPEGPKEALGHLKTPKGTIPIVKRESSIGRDPELEIHVDDPAASWHHALISASGDGLYVRDLGSRNGTYVNAELLTLPRRLIHGDVIHAGNTDLIFGLPDGAQINRPGRTVWALLVTAGPASGRRVALESLPLVLGRDEGVGVAGLDDQFISGRHLKICEVGGGLVAQDLGSLNGTALNGARLEPDQPTPLSAGDELRLGPATVLKLEKS